jgi:16S rRNA (uracil1498-N3)-methyltransferase
VNLILFEPSELERPLPRKDRRAIHIIEVLRRKPGDTFDVGLLNGPRGKATLDAVSTDTVALTFAWSASRPELIPTTLLVGLPRPQTARDILRDATTLGVTAIHFVRTERTERSYSQSTLWSSGEWRRHLITGAEQAFDTRIPEVTHTRNLLDAVATLGSGARVALDNYEAAIRLGDFSVTPGNDHVLAIGGERGWSSADREILRGNKFAFAHLGERVLRTETATVAALSILRTKLGLM